MIVTLTANPSIDRTMTLVDSLQAGEVHRAATVVDQAGGKGVNVARVVALAGVEACAVVPADAGDPVIEGLADVGVPVVNLPIGARCRVNITVSEPDGRTTKLNAPGNPLNDRQLASLAEALVLSSTEGDWVVLAGSLPSGVVPSWYADVTARLRAAGRRVAVDTSGKPLAALLDGPTMPNLIKPNSDELASLTGDDPAELEADVDAAIDAARRLVDRGVDTVLLTLGGAGAALISVDGVWQASPPPITVVSTVGAGDSSLAGYLIADAAGLTPDACLRSAVAFGSAAAALPGTTMPTPDDLNLDGVTVTSYSTAAAKPTTQGN